MFKKSHFSKSNQNIIAKLASATLAIAAISACNLASSATITWKGHVWDVTGAEPIGAPSSGQINGNASNVMVDSNGYLHVKITQSGSTFTGAQLFTQDNLGFGTYQFQIEGDITNMEKGVVLGLFPYGPTAGIGVDGENEIDIEFSKWNDVASGNNADFTYYPPTGHGDANYTASFEHNFFINFGGATQSTSRIEWTPTNINSTIMTGFQPIGTTANVVSPADNYAPSSPSTKIPQVALPVGINLWTYGSKPTKALDIVIRDFTFVPRCTSNCSSSSKSSSVATSSSSSSSTPANTNIAPSGAGATWSKNTTATANTNKLSNSAVVDNQLNDINVNPAGENGQVRYEAAGVTWSTTKTITSVKFTNGTFNNGDGVFGSGLSLQYTTNGTTWVESGWSVSPSYPYTSAASGVTYSFSGAQLTGVTGVRVSGKTSATAWFWSVKEVQAIGH